jgi:hypothetical protein
MDGTIDLYSGVNYKDVRSKYMYEQPRWVSDNNIFLAESGLNIIWVTGCPEDDFLYQNLENYEHHLQYFYLTILPYG